MLIGFLFTRRENAPMGYSPCICILNRWEGKVAEFSAVTYRVLMSSGEICFISRKELFNYYNSLFTRHTWKTNL